MVARCSSSSSSLSPPYLKTKSPDPTQKIRKRKNSKRRRGSFCSNKSRPHDDSISFSDDDDDESQILSFSSSSSSSEDDYNGRNRVSERRKVKKSQIKITGTSRSGKNAVRKTKKSKENYNNPKSKKKNLKKRSTRNASLTSSSSDSLNCTPKKGNYRQMKRSKGKSKSKTSLKECGYDISRSSSPNIKCSLDHHSDHPSMGGHETKRIKSIITSAGNQENKDEFIEEIDYRNKESPRRCCDSNEGFTIKESYNHSVQIDATPAKNSENTISIDQNEVQTNDLRARNIPFDGVIGGNNRHPKDEDEMGSSFVDLESTLRERALENLRKFRQGVQKNELPPKFKSSDFHQDDKHNIPSMNTIEANSTQILCEPNDEHVRSGGTTSSPCRENISTSEINVGEQMPSIKGCSAEKSVVDSGNGKGERGKPRLDDLQDGERNGGVSRADRKDDASQFEHKTISVMRGGEMVQVSYKVYIPKKAPTLPRRQLHR